MINNKFINNTFGIVVYDVHNGVGAIIMNDSRYQNDKDIILDHNDLFKSFNGFKIGYTNCIWEFHGHALYKNNQIIFDSKTDQQYDDIYNDMWKIKYYKYNIFNQNGEHYNEYESDIYQLKTLNENKSIITLNDVSKL